jgi:very-short-patch-repair endonuclease
VTDAGPTVGNVDPAFEKVESLLDFLEAYYRISRPPVRDISVYREFMLREPNLPSVPGVTFIPGGDVWLTSTLVAHSNLPEIPPDLQQWLDSTSISAQVRPTVELSNEPSDEEFAGALSVEEWAETVWEPWAAEWIAIERSRSFYKDLYALRTRLERDGDGYELVWGFGRLRWSSDSGLVDHPLVSVPVEILLGDDGRLAVSVSGASEIGGSFIADLELADHAQYLSYRNDDAAADVDLWNPESRDSLFERLLRTISHDGLRSPEAPKSHDPVLADEWVLYLRRRQADYVAFLDQQRELYRSGVVPSLPFLSLVADRPSELTSESTTVGVRGDQIVDSTLYLPKEANEEQFRILRLAQQRAGVTAQGPPGTGKSHTIANLICHFVSEGKRVLVTAEKEQALSVLSEKLPPGIRELSVTVGGGDAASYTKLERAVTAIQGKVSSFDRAQIDRSIDQSSAEIARIDAEQALVSNQLRTARSFEADHLSGSFEAGSDPTPTEIATWLAALEDELSFVLDPVELSESFPLDEAEWRDFVRLCKALHPDDVAACLETRPTPGLLPTGSSLGQMFSELGQLRSQLADIEDEVSSWEKLDSATDALDGLRESLREAAEWRRKITGTWLETIRSECLGELGRKEWEAFAQGINAAREQAIVQRIATAAHTVEIPVDPTPEFREGLREAQERLSEGKRISSLLQRQAARALEMCSTDGRTPTELEQVGLCFAALIRQDSQRELASRWKNGTSRIGGPELLADRPVEDTSVEHLAGVLRAIKWGIEELPSLRLAIEQAGFRMSSDPSIEELDHLVSVLEMATRRARELTLIGELGKVENLLNDQRLRGSSAIWDRLGSAFSERFWNEWDNQLKEASRLTLLESEVAKFSTLGNRLRTSAPRFTEELVSTQAPNAPEHVQMVRAWQWRKLDQWLTLMTSGPSTGELQLRLESLARRRLNEMERLVEARAWRGLSAGFTDENRGSLNKYLTAVKRFGKTGGKYAERWRREIRVALDESKDAIPVWIMPASRVLESFRPAEVPPFDVLIVDESSQIGLLGLPILSLGKKAIVVGDDQQTSPENVGLDRQAVFNLIDAHLGQVRDSRTLFDADNSLYDVSRQKFPEIVVLREHFRCLPQIIGFSNGRYYGGEMIPLRDRPPTPSWQPVGTVFVPDGFRNGNDVNEPEAQAAVDLIQDLVADPTYDGMTFGFIGLLGRVQSLRVMELLLDRLGLDVIEDRKIRCGEAADFQGDERDVVILSTVVDGSRRIGAFTDRRSERRLNVAASRAKEQLWVIHSIEPEDFPNGDGRAELIRHCQNPAAVEAAYSNQEQRCESQFEKDVLRAILERGYRRVRTQHSAGRYRIDMVVEGPTSRLAVECDGDRWHGQDQWDADRSRQQILERSGWTFERIRGSAFFRHRERSLEPLWSRLTELGIQTGEWGQVDGSHLAVRRVSPTMAERMAMAPVSPQTGISLEVLEEQDMEFHESEVSRESPTDASIESDLLNIRPSSELTETHQPPWPETISSRGSNTSDSPLRSSDQRADESVREGSAQATAIPPLDEEESRVPTAGAANYQGNSSSRAVTSDLIGPQEVAELLGVEPNTVHQWRKRGDTIRGGAMPDPTAVISGVPLWTTEDIVNWARGSGRIGETRTIREKEVQVESQDMGLSPYNEWPVRNLVGIHDGTPEDVIDELVEIVSSEGPMLGHVLYRLHAKGAGAMRLRGPTRSSYNKLAYRAIREGRLSEISDDIPGQAEKTIYLPGTEPVVLRKLGNRDIHEVPPSEIRELASRLGVGANEGEAGKRLILNEYGLRKLTQKTGAYLDECLIYQWSR